MWSVVIQENHTAFGCLILNLFLSKALNLKFSQLLQVFFRKSFSISSLPIFKYNLSGSSSFCLLLPGLSKTIEGFSRNSCFHWEIWLGWTSNLAASSDSVSLSFNASIATLALKLELNLRLFLHFSMGLIYVFFQLSTWSNFFRVL